LYCPKIQLARSSHIADRSVKVERDDMENHCARKFWELEGAAVRPLNVLMLIKIARQCNEGQQGGSITVEPPRSSMTLMMT